MENLGNMLVGLLARRRAEDMQQQFHADQLRQQAVENDARRRQMDQQDTFHRDTLARQDRIENRLQNQDDFQQASRQAEQIPGNTKMDPNAPGVGMLRKFGYGQDVLPSGDLQQGNGGFSPVSGGFLKTPTAAQAQHDVENTERKVADARAMAQMKLQDDRYNRDFAERQAEHADTVRHQNAMEARLGASEDSKKIQLTPDQLQAYVSIVRGGGTLPTFRGSNTNDVVNQIYGEAHRQDPNINIPLLQATTKARAAALTDMTKNEAAVSSFADTADRNRAKFDELVAKGDVPDYPDLPFGAQWANQAARAAARVSGSTAMSDWDTFRQSLKSEYERMVYQAKLTGVPIAEGARKEMEASFAPGATHAQMKHALDVFKLEGANRDAAMKATMGRLSGGIGQPSAGTPLPSDRPHRTFNPATGKIE